MKLPEEFGTSHNSAEAMATAYREVPVRLLEGTKDVAEELHELLGDRLLTASECLYWPMVNISQPSAAAVGENGVEEAVKSLNKSRSYGLQHRASFATPELPNVRPGELVPIVIDLRTTATDELLVESRLIQHMLFERKISSTPTMDMKIHLTDQPVSYGLFRKTFDIIQPHANRNKTLGSPTVASIRIPK